MAESLKSNNRLTLVLILLLNLALFAALLATNALMFPGAVEIMSKWESLIPAGLALFVAGVLNEQLSPVAKARLVFWRWNEPLPARAAFSKLGPGDSRVNMGRIEGQIGSLPTDPKEQNQAWYKLYRSVKDDPAVHDVHRSFLLYRDCTATIALLFLPLTAIALWQVRPVGPALAFAGILLVEYLVFRRAAAGAGCRFVNTVLAIKSAEA